jgi:hypothetical protein
VWFPGCPISLEGDPTQTPKVSDLRTSMSPTGRVLGLTGNTFYRHRNVTWSHVDRNRVWESAATYENGSWQTFFEETQLGAGSSWFTPSSPVQIYYDSAGSVALLGGEGGPDGAGVEGWTIVGVSSIEPRPSVAGWTGLWRIECPLLIAEGE